MKGWPLGFFLLTACSSELTTAGRSVLLLNSLPASEAQRYEDVGKVSCSEPTEFIGQEESCRNSLRNQAAAKGADLLVIENSRYRPCSGNRDDSCAYMNARVYRRKQTQAH